ncbi:acyl-CoA dehydrogenase family protein [Desulfallas sp. Bu1-1]|uniref:acyl-CoA dehydrogenase family protein n=1 Tax=Desulfallas sp. Bu1-1 TaxID=2787620 RepID=UPI00189E85E3|nr:acyl-CoA dehydrogenase family protein [Desulfallas sp. Bu1-1]MBF7082998.1 acyl-CoA dehydrogenase family protein [Desulfallas sp. Bu1-1]
MDFNLPEDIMQLKKMAANFTRRELIPKEEELRKTGQLNQSTLQKMKELGFYGLTIPEEYSGMGIGALGYCVVMEELAKGPKAYLHEVSLSNGIGSRAILIGGSEEQKKKYLPGIAKGEILVAFALTEPNAGSDASAIQTTARQEGDYWVLNGTKHFISNGAVADIVTVMALTDREKRSRGGITAFIVEKGTPGFSVQQLQETMAGPPVIQAELVFEDCRVPSSNIIGQVGHGFDITMETLTEGRLQYGAMALGMAQRLLDMSVDYAKQRVQFGKPIATKQAIQFMLADMATEIYAARQILYNAAARHDNGEKLVKESAMVKLYNTEMVCRVADRAVQIFGGMGYMSELPIERMYREARVMRIVEGTSEIQRIVIARELLRD